MLFNMYRKPQGEVFRRAGLSILMAYGSTSNPKGAVKTLNQCLEEEMV